MSCFTVIPGFTAICFFRGHLAKRPPATKLVAKWFPRQSGSLIDAVTAMIPDKEVSHIVLRRGVDRMLGPLKVMRPGEGPLRKMICIRRRFEDVVIEPEWENWERLSYRSPDLDVSVHQPE